MTAAKANDVLNMARKSAWDTRQARDVIYSWHTLHLLAEREGECWLIEKAAKVMLDYFVFSEASNIF